MSSDIDLALQARIEQLLYREAYYLDTRDWDRWLELFGDDVQYWIPAWVSEDSLATDPETELSLIYCDGKDGLEDRVFRIRTGDSFASSPLPRTCHVIGNVLVLGSDNAGIDVSAAWTVHQYQDIKGPRVHGGRYIYRLESYADRLVIASKQIIFLNDAIDIPLDIYNV